MSLFDGIPLDPPPARPGITSPAYVVTLKHASNGEEILLCNVSPPPEGALADARSRKLPIFTLDEIAAVRSAAADDPRTIDSIIAARRLYGWGGPITYQGQP